LPTTVAQRREAAPKMLGPSTPERRMTTNVARSFGQAVMLIGSIALVVGCSPALSIPDKQRQPDAVGVVASQSYTPNVGLAVTLEDGRTMTFQDWNAIALTGSVPTAGDLLMAGTSDGQAWAISIARARSEDAPPDCFALTTRGIDEGSGIVTEVGIRLVRTPDFDRGLGRNGHYDAPITPFCLDAKGVATRYGW
jgi:hypothetical protein